MTIYVEVIEFTNGNKFLKRYAPFYSKDCFRVYDQAVDKFSKSGKTYIVAMRNDNHSLVKAIGNVTPSPKYIKGLKAVKGK